MNLDSTDLPSVLRLPSKAEDIASFILKQILEHSPSVIVLDLDQGSAVLHSKRSEAPGMGASSLPFLLSNHTLNMAGVSPSMEDCLSKLEGENSPTLLGVFINPEHKKDLPPSDAIFFSSVVTEGSVVAYVESEGVRTLNLINIGDTHD
jgi:hypothetical protein